MAFGLDDPEKQRAALFVLLIVGGSYAFWQYLYAPLHEQRVAVEEHADALVALNDQARALTQPTRLRELQRKEAEYQVRLAEYETLLPSQAEVPTLLEEVAFAAIQNHVQIANFAPLEPVRGNVLVEVPYDLQVQGGYHDIGRFLADVVNLPRLVRPVVNRMEQVEIKGEDESEPPGYEVLVTVRLSTFIPASAVAATGAGEVSLRNAAIPAAGPSAARSEG